MIPRVLVVAGSDSSGGAGLEADQRTLAAHGCYAMTATTALTAQNTLGVEDVHVTPPAFVGKQIRKVMEDGFMDDEPGIVKIGMLASAETISVVAQTLREWQEMTGKELKIVLDPVMVATSGAQLLQGDAIRNLRDLLLPMTTVLTPNIPEATLLLRDADIQYRTPSNLNDLKALAQTLHRLGPKQILLKGGHMPLTKSYTKAQTDDEKDITIDILYPCTRNPTSPPQDSDFTIIESTYLLISNTHGTGCSLASSLAAHIAHSSLDPCPTHLSTSVRSAIKYVSDGILNSQLLQRTLHSRGPGPINHLHSLLHSPFPHGYFLAYLLSHPSVTLVWDKYIHHPFTSAIANGTLPPEIFKQYLVQDYLYLTCFARAHALAAYKARSVGQIAASADIIKSIEEEMGMHLKYCEEEFGIMKEEIESAEESTACVAYGRWVLDVGMQGDLLALWVALAACAVGYEVVGEMIARIWETDNRKERSGVHVKGGEGKETEIPLAKEDDGEKGKRKGRRYARWVETYTSETYRASVKKTRELIEDEVIRQGGLGKGRAEELVEIFRRAVLLEAGFWDVYQEEQAVSGREKE